jgi:hypothetical protein
MSQPYKRTIANHVLIELIEADVDTGFSLIDVAHGESCRGNLAFSAQALEQAEAMITDISHRLAQLGPEESAPFQPLIEELRREIESARL